MFLSGIFVLSILTTKRFSKLAHATKHTFHTRNDGRFLIAPIGAPFGFLQGGSCKLSVYEYHLEEIPSHSKKLHSLFHKKQKETPPSASSVGSTNAYNFEGGFLLKRFETESDFAKFEESVLEDPSKCIFEHFRQRRRRLIINDDDFEYDDDFTDDELQLDDDDMFRFDDHEADDYSVLPQKATIVSDATKDGIYLSMKDQKTWNVVNTDEAPSITHDFKPKEEGLYFLIYQVCPIGEPKLFTKINSSFEVNLELLNYDNFGSISYLTAGEMPLPRLFFCFSISYSLLLFLWIRYLRGESIVKQDRALSQKKPNVNVRQIHHLMTALLTLKTLSIFFEGVRYHYIRVSGHAEVWSFVYYTLNCLKGIMLFTVILLIGSGWSLVKPFLHDREKKIIFLILMLQVLDNIAVVVLLQDTEGERQYENWKAILHFIDILCCCTVLFPIVWQVSALEADAESEESARAVRKLKLFRTFYVLVVSYIYFTRVVVFLVATVLGFRYTWMSFLLSELGTMVFYVIVGYKFKPITENEGIEMKEKEKDEEIEFLVNEDGAVENVSVPVKLKD